MKQLRPNPGLFHDIPLDLQGRAQFMHEGFVVDVQFREVKEDETYLGSHLTDWDADDVVEITATIIACDVELAQSSSTANLHDKQGVHRALEEAVGDVVSYARAKVTQLNDFVAKAAQKAVERA